MKSNIIILVFLMIITALFSSEIELSEQEKDWLEEHRYSIRYAPNPDYPPICFMDKNGKPTGLNTDYIEIFEQKLGLKFQIVNCETWSDMLKKIKNKEIDMMGAIQNTEERREFLNFTDPYIVVPNKIITNDRQTEELNLENMTGKKIVIVDGYSIIDHIKQLYPDLNIIPVKDNPTGLEMVSFGTADVMITDIAVASYYMKKLGITNLKVSGNVDYDWVLTFACRKDWAIFSSILNKTLDCIPENQKNDIFNKWIFIKPTSIFYRSETIIIFISSILLGIIIILGFFVWNRSLKKQVKIRTLELENDILQKEESKAALQLSEQKYRNLFEKMMDAFALHEMVFDINNEPVDYIFIEVNHAFEEQTGLKKEDIIGKKVTEVIPGIENDPVDWIGVYGKVVLSGKEVRFEQYAEVLERWYSVLAYLPAKNHFAVIFKDITRQKEVEKELQKHQEHLEELVKERTKKLEEKNRELEEFNLLFVNREFRIKELKEKIAELEGKLS